MEVSFIKVLLTILTFIATSHACCNRVTDPSRYPTPELKFPGLSEYAASEKAKGVASLLTTIATSLANFIPGGQVVGPITSGLTAMDTILSGTNSEFVKLVEQGLANQTIFDIRASLATIKKQMKLVELHMVQKEDYSDVLSNALFECDRILEKYKDESGPLFRHGNVLVSAPSLLSFSALYPGIAGISYKRWPTRRAHILEEMDVLVSIVEKYKNQVLIRRMAYLQIGNLFRSSCDKYCSDTYHELISCDSCKRVECDTLTILEKNYDMQLYRNYKQELRRKYEQYFQEPLKKLKALVHQIRNS